VTDVLAGGSHSAHPTVNGSPFPPIAEYGFLSDCEVCALVAPSGAVEWMCLPREDERRSGGATPAGLDLHAGTAAGPGQAAGSGQ
jgi:hypothetical protein